MLLITKVLHIVFVTSWFAGLFYLPRIFVNLAQDDHIEVQKRLLLHGAQALSFHELFSCASVAFWYLFMADSGYWQRADVATYKTTDSDIATWLSSWLWCFIEKVLAR